MAVETTNKLKPATAQTVDPSHRAWRVLLASFCAFCLLVTAGCYGVWHFRSFASGTPTRPAVLSLSSENGVYVQQRGMVVALQAHDGRTLQEGDTVSVDPSTGPGVAAQLELFDGTLIELWPGTTLHLNTIQHTRFNNYRQSIGLTLDEGMVRLHIPNRLPYQQAEFTVLTTPGEGQPAEVSFEAGGVYLVRLLEEEAPTTARALWDEAPSTEVTVQQGRATLRSGTRSINIVDGEQARIDDEGVDGPLSASWELIRDGDFSQFTEREYNCTTGICGTEEISSTTWTVVGEPMQVGAPENGYFRITTGPMMAGQWEEGERINAANFTRFNSQGKGFRVHVQQRLNADVTAYNDLTLSADLRILYQSLPKAGDAGVECPITIHLEYLDAKGNRAPFDYCYYARDDERLPEAAVKHIRTNQLPYGGEWERVTLDLFNDIPDMRALEEIWIYANGHDYAVEVANVSLVAR